MHKKMTQMLILAALAMSVGWGWRGDYGHEAGAMVPGALLALAICLASGREDWIKRASVLALLGAIGWAFGGQMSYGIVIGYTAASSFVDVLYGYVGLFVIGALWGSVGAGILALGVTESRSELERFVGPLVAFYVVLTGLNLSGATDWLSDRWSLHDSDWVAATAALLTAGVYAWLRPQARKACALIAVLAAGWWIGLAVLALLLNLRMTPPRSDNWAGCVGLWIALVIYLYKMRNRAAVLLSFYGLLAGGIGFAVADCVNMAGRAQWGFLGASETFRGMDAWKWMEQLFGFVMGFGVAWGFARLAKALSPPNEDDAPGTLRFMALAFLLIAMPWENLHKNVADWTKANTLAEGLFGLSPQRWFLFVALLLAAVLALAIWKHCRDELPFIPTDAFGRAQLLFLSLLWLAVVADFARVIPVLKSKGVLYVHLTFWLTALLCTGMVLMRRREIAKESATVASDQVAWRLGWRYVSCWLVVPLLLFGLAKLTMAMHTEPLPGSHLRFGTLSP
ncbi:MAG: hypothetical protein JNM09_23420 [Blastocatellia bacterium]|nr:hypothetical protein [Blastocatellia bacterium]